MNALEELIKQAILNNQTIYMYDLFRAPSEKQEEMLLRVPHELAEIFEHDVSLQYVYEGKVSSMLSKCENPLILLNTPLLTKSGLDLQIGKFLAAVQAVKEVKEKKPSVQLYLTTSMFTGILADTNASSQHKLAIPVMKQILGLYGFLDVADRIIGLGECDYHLDYLEALPGGLRHGYGKEKDKQFIDFLSTKFNEGNLQSSFKESFVMISDRLENLGGKFRVYRQDKTFAPEDFVDCTAIFVDNNYELYNNSTRIGKGITVLDELAKMNLTLPIFYQTAHALESFTESERQEITSHPNVVLLPKNLAPKLSLSKKVALKELRIGELIATHPELQRECIKTHPVGETGYLRAGDRFITFSVAGTIQRAPHPEKIALYNRLGIVESPLINKLYTLALFHTLLKPHITDPQLQCVGKPFLDYERITTQISNALPHTVKQLQLMNGLYQEIAEKQIITPPKTIIHNDAKWDNWFYDSLLGDYGSACPGQEYKDVAYVLLTKEKLMNGGYALNDIAYAADQYIRIRSAIDPEFNESVSHFRKGVYAMMFTESLRIAQYKSQQSNTALTQGLVNLADKVSKSI